MEEKDIVYDYVIKDGKVQLSDQSSLKRTESFLRHLHPFEDMFMKSKKKRDAMMKVIYENVDIDTPTIIICNDDIHRMVFGSLLCCYGRKKNLEYFSWIETSVANLLQAHLHSDYTNVAEMFSSTDIVLCRMNFDEPKNYLAPHLVKSLAVARSAERKRTFFFFLGTKEQFLSDKWKIDEYGDGTIRTPLPNSIDVVDLNKFIGKMRDKKQVIKEVE